MENEYLYCKEKDYTLYKGEMQKVLDTLEEESIDSIVCDPPYHLTSITKRFGKNNSAKCQYGKDGSFQRLSRGFMGKTWDGGDIAFQPETWEHAYRVLKPGGYLLAFGGSRTYHRIACAIEDAGFEIRDCIMWLYGSGFPKSHDVGLEVDKRLGIESKVVGKTLKVNSPLPNNKDGSWCDNVQNEEFEVKEAQNEWKGWGTSLKPAFEPIIVARKPFLGSLVDNVLTYGVGALNIDECRIPTEEEDIKNLYRKPTKYEDKDPVAGMNASEVRGSVNEDYKKGRFPANVITDGSDEVVKHFPYTKSGKMTSEHQRHTDGSPNGIYGKFDVNHPLSETYGDSGSASRFFYCAKASQKDRDEGLDLFEEKQTTGANSALRKNIHPTVKPVELMQYLVRLVSPKGSTVLDCFMGSGSTGKACMFENRERNANYHFIGVEMTDEYLPIAQSRIDYALNKYEYDLQKELDQAKEEAGQMNIFDFIKE